ncbi:RICIN domain-containing protein [Paraburkholderia youngii]|uniref:RICIN domain-containing protein n=1 Tax=Paraburkholderia youngii TaxID=2782701 RepID=UPI003D21E87E
MRALLLIAFLPVLSMYSTTAHAQTSSTITVNGTSLCADVDAQSTTPGASVIQWTFNGQNNELWTLTQNNGLYQFVNVNSNLCLDIYGVITDAGAGADQWTCNGQVNQSFQLISPGGGFAIVASQSNLCLAVPSLTARQCQLEGGLGRMAK